MLATLVSLLAAAAIAVPLSRRGGFGSVMGYLVAGIVIGPVGLRLVTDVEQIARISGLGVVMLLFLIGLEVRPTRLWVMRRVVFGLGAAQMAAAGAVLAFLAGLLGVPWRGAVVLGLGGAMSSTAIVLPMLAERGLLATRAGRDGFAVLLFQDLAFVPLVALVPLVASGDLPDRVPLADVARAAAAIAAILLGGPFLIRPTFRLIGGARTPEVFTIMALLIVVGAAALASAGGLSVSLGAFMAGVLFSGSEYRHELQADIEPFEGLLLGFFFISVGMSANLGLGLEHPGFVALAVLGLLGVKIAVLFALGRLAGQDRASAARFALALPQGSEFGFVLFLTALSMGALQPEQADIATLAIALSMVATPLLFAASERFLIPRLRPPRAEPAYDTITPPPAPVIVCGFGRVGQIVGRVLRMQRIHFTALETDPGQVEVIRRFGTKVYFGDPARAEVLRAAGAEQARLLVVAMSNVEEVLKVVDMAQRNFPNLAILARARNRHHAYMLMDRNVQAVVRDTFYSSLRLAELALLKLGVPEARAARAVSLFAEHDERLLLRTHAIYQDEKQVIQSVREAADELRALFEEDQPEGEERGEGHAGAGPAAS